MADLVTLAEVKARLELSDTDASRDAVIDALRVAVQEKVLDLTGFIAADSDAPVTKSEQQTEVRLGEPRYMRYRPLQPMSSDPARAVRLEARSLASGTLNSILGDLTDVDQGKIIPLASELTPVFPPIGGVAPWYRWRQMVWPVVVFTYLVVPITPATAPAALKAAIVEWAAFVWSMKPMSGRLKSFTAEKISETYDNYKLDANAMPPVVAALLGKYMARGTTSLVF